MCDPLIQNSRVRFLGVDLIQGLILPFILCLLSGYELFSQSNFIKSNCPRSMKQAYVWYFGDHAGIDFRSGTAIALTDQDSMTAYKSSSVISDSMGNLLFFTNGRKVWDQTHQLMPNAT